MSFRQDWQFLAVLCLLLAVGSEFDDLDRSSPSIDERKQLYRQYKLICPRFTCSTVRAKEEMQNVPQNPSFVSSVDCCFCVVRPADAPDGTCAWTLVCKPNRE
jgi:hypothetical protein